MNVGGVTPWLIKLPLYGFDREIVYAVGAFQVPVTFGQLPTQVTQMVAFLLVDQPSAYNAILGRLTLNAIRPSVST